MSNPAAFFSKEDKDRIRNAIEEAELNTSGEIRLHVESRCRIDVLDRAAFWFDQLNMQKTQMRNGVLFYLAIDDRKFAIIGDAGINGLVDDNFWEKITEEVLLNFQKGLFAEGLSLGIIAAGMQLKEHFPYQSDDVNELSDDISFGK